MDNLIVNGNFSDGYTGWAFRAPEGSTIVVADGVARLTVAARNENIQLFQSGIVLKPIRRYRLSFRAAADGPHSLAVHIHRNTAPYSSYGLANYIVDVDRAAQSFSVYFTTTAGVLDDGRLRFWLAPYADIGSVYRISDVSLVEVSGDERPEMARPKRIIHVIARRLEPGESLEVRFVEPGRIVALEDGGIDWVATPWRLVSTYVHD